MRVEHRTGIVVARPFADGRRAAPACPPSRATMPASSSLCRLSRSAIVRPLSVRMVRRGRRRRDVPADGTAAGARFPVTYGISVSSTAGRSAHGTSSSILTPGFRVGAGAAADEDVHGLDHLAVDADVLAQQADVGGGMIAAACRTSRPVRRDPLTVREPRREDLGGLDGDLLGLDQREVAIVDAGARDQPAQRAGRIVRAGPRAAARF